MQEIELLGVSIKDRRLRESLEVAQSFLDDGILEVVSYISMENLMHAAEDGAQKQWLESLDMTLSADEEILRAAGITDRTRLREVRHNGFLREFLRRLAKGTVPVYLLSKTEKDRKLLEEGLLSQQWNLLIAGQAVWEEYEEDRDKLINAINALAPKVIISNFPYPEDMELISYCKPFVNGEEWLQIPHNCLAVRGQRQFLVRLQKKLVRKHFHKRVSSFQEHKES